MSPVKTAFSSASCMNQQMLSWVWHGVCSARTAIWPMARSSPWAGVCETLSQSLPPRTLTGFPSFSSCQTERHADAQD